MTTSNFKTAVSAAATRKKLAGRGRIAYSKDVETPRRAPWLFAAVLIVAPLGLRAQSVSSPSAAATPPPSVSAGVFPLSEVHRGLHGTAYTVFEGVNPEPMGVEILGVLHNALGPHQDMILARLEGKKPEYTGVVAGMSGSPVYINGKLAGALAFRIGQFSKEPIAGITPIQQMLQVRDLPMSPSLQTGGDAPASAGKASATGIESEVKPIETPLLFSGFSPAAVKEFGDKFAALGLTPVAGIGGGSSDIKQPEPIVPGSAVSALLVRGDMEIAATCTATYVDPKQLLACGHPITQYGDISVPMTKAEVVATLPSPLNAFKIVNTTEEVGAFNQDRQTAIRGVFGGQARMIPVSVRMRKGDAETAGRMVRFDVADNPDLTPILLMISVYQALMESNSYGAETTYGVRGRIVTQAGPTVRLDELEAPTEQMPSALSTALVVGERFQKLYANRARRTPLRSVDLEIDASPGRKSLEIESVEAGHGTVRPGDTVQVEATLRPWHGEAEHVTIPVKIPATLPSGPVRLVVSDGATLDRMLEAPGWGQRDLDVTQTADELNAMHTNDRLYVTMLDPEPQAVVDGRTLSGVPLSLANALEPLRANRALTLNGESAAPVASMAMHAMVQGQQVLTLEVE
jgi:hypothetical protein